VERAGKGGGRLGAVFVVALLACPTALYPKWTKGKKAKKQRGETV